ncbi:autotransporter-associated beta strand repeat-containing protein [Sphingomonas sp. HF-S4]|uniref:Autotransporter-associated beta strand repeat-containing protein n=1 Tax=Sphingomonas agrestis TaxID=3080540 RepID=A0ABU3YCT0_9SPHN|nr:autotransporter-associated beta strand repeat-containing protein [Sphingomonas sp. HF-S4]MDV3459201.1 autotransporter-associated beta strand repeat-containing protein [Sphingomonas sp. HF-S4]
MTVISTAASGRIRSARAFVLAGTAVGALLAPATAQAQNLASSGSTDYSHTETGTRSGGPRTVDITTSGGNISLDLGTIEVLNNGNTTGAGVAATNTGPGNVTIDVDAVTASGTGATNGVDARAASGNVIVTTGTVNSSGNNNSRGIQAISGGGDITINADTTTGGLRGIFTGSNGGVFPDVTTIVSKNATAIGTGQVNAIIGQGQTVDITSGTARITNTAGFMGTAIYANAGTGGAIVRSGTAEALGNRQAAIQIYSDGSVLLESANASTTQNSDGLSVQSGTDVTIRSGTVSTTGATGARGIVVNVPGAPLDLTSEMVTTQGADSTAMLITGGAGAVKIDSGTIATRGANSVGIDLAGQTGATVIASDAITTVGEFAYGISVASTGAVDISSGSITATGQYSEGITVGSSGSLKIASGTIATTGNISSAIYARSSGAIDVTSEKATSGAGSLGVYLSNRGSMAGTLTLTSGEVLGAKNGIAAYGQDATTVTSGTVTLAGASTVASPGYGISARSANGAVSVTSGTIDGIEGGASFGIDARAAGANTATITSGSISAYGDGGFGIHGATDTGALTIASTGAITTTGTTATNVRDSGAVNPSTAPRETRPSHGIWATSTNGPISIDNAGTISTSGAAAFGIFAQSTTGAITVESDTVNTSGLAAQGIWAQTTNGNILINAGTTRTAAIGWDAAAGGTSDAVFGYSSGTGSVTVTSQDASSAGDYASAVGGVGGGAVNITSGTASSSGFQLATVYGSSRNSDVTINSTNATATGVNAYAVEGHAANGNLTITSGTASAEHGNAVFGDAGGLVTVNATTATARGDGGTAVAVTGGTGVVLTVGSASSNGTVVTNQQTSVTYRADAVFAQATNGAINATIGSATATGAGMDAVHLIANGTGGAVSATITGAVSSTSGTGLWIDPPGQVNINVGTGASVAGGANGINTVGGANSIVNLGTVSSTGGAAILASGPTTLDNSGTITAGTGAAAVQFGVSNDTVILRTGSTVTGTIVGGGGTDAAVLIGTGATPAATQTIAGFAGFDSLRVQSGYWTAPAAGASPFNRTTIDAGATLGLVNGANGIAGLSTPSIVDNGTLVVTSSASSGAGVFGTAVVTGTGGVRFTGAGTATLDGVNSLQNTGTNLVDAGSTVLVTGTQGGAFVNNGTFQIGTGGTTGNFTGNLIDNGTLIVNRSDAYTFVGALSGSGTFVKEGAGTITFGSGYGFTGTTVLNGGGIKLTTAVATTTELQVEGTGTVDFSGTNQQVAELAGTSRTASVNIAGGSLTVNQNSNTAFAGSLTGNGSFTKSGTGSLNFTGVNTYTGPTNVNGGRLAVNGSIVSPLTVNSGGTLGGTGTVGNTTIGSGGTWAPGNSIGTQTVNGNVTFAAGSIFAVEVNAAGQSDRVNATGTATIAGGTVQVLAEAGIYAPLTNYTILTAAAGVNGRFTTVTSNLAFLTPLLSYGTNNVVLTLGRNDTTFASQAASGNQRAVAAVVTARGLGDPIYNTVLVQSAAGARNTFDQLSGELHAALPSVLIDDNRRVRDAVLTRGLVDGDGIGMWAQGLQDYAGSRNQEGFAKIDSNRTGVIGGVDYGAGDLRVGVNGGYFDQDLTLGARGSNASVKTKLAGASLAWNAQGSFTAQVGGTWAWHDIDTARAISVSGIAGTSVASSKAESKQAFGELGYDLVDGPLDLGMFVRYAHDWTDVDAVAETGGVAALRVGDTHRETNSASVGLRMGGSAPVSTGLSIAPRASLAYIHSWGDLGGTRSVAFGTGPGFAIGGSALGSDALDVDLGIDLVTESGLRFGIGGFANASDQWGDYGAKASVSLRF